jgi:hypothetical protein
MEQFTQPISQQLRTQALSLPETSEGTSCVNRAFKVRKKNFLFVGEKLMHENEMQVRVMLKLDASLDEARAMNDPRIDVGNTGWVTVRFAPDDVPDERLLSAWVVESFRALGPKTLIKQLDEKL